MTHEDIVEELRNRIKPREVHTIDTLLTGVLQEEFKNIGIEELAMVDRLGEHYRANYSSSKGKIDYGQVSMGYALHYMPAYYAKIQNMLLELFRKDLLPENMRILDVGAGTGSATFAIANFFTTLNDVLNEFGDPRNFDITVKMVERSKENIGVFNKLWTGYTKRWGDVADLWDGSLTPDDFHIEGPVNAEVSIDSRFKKSSYGKYDLVIFSNVLCEISGDKTSMMHEFMQMIKPDGSLVVVEPADKHGTNIVSWIRMFKKDLGWNVYSPCAVWHPFCVCQHEYTGDCAFCSIEKRDINPVLYNRRRSKTDMKYAYVILRQDGAHTHIGRPPEEYTKLSELHRIPNLPVGNVHVRVIRQREKKMVGREIRNQEEYGTSYYICDGTSGRAHTQLVAIGSKQREVAAADDGDIIDIRNAHAARAPQEDKWCNYEIIATGGSEIRILRNTL